MHSRTGRFHTVARDRSVNRPVATVANSYVPPSKGRIGAPTFAETRLAAMEIPRQNPLGHAKRTFRRYVTTRGATHRASIYTNG